MLRDTMQSSINPKRYAELNHTLEGVLPLASLTLPVEVLDGATAEATYSLTFHKDIENFVYIQGWIESNLTLQCQRCLKPMQQLIRSEFCLSPVKTVSEAEKLPERYEAVLMEEDRIDLSRIIEEELILNLPIVPLHEGQCQDSSLGYTQTL